VQRGSDKPRQGQPPSAASPPKGRSDNRKPKDKPGVTLHQASLLDPVPTLQAIDEQSEVLVGEGEEVT
jgi:hypothetical protein